GTVLGQMTESFSWAVKSRLLFKAGSPWPETFEGARVTSIETVAGDPDDTQDLEIGPGGYWLVPRLAGLVQGRWPTDKEDENDCYTNSTHPEVRISSAAGRRPRRGSSGPLDAR